HDLCIRRNAVITSRMPLVKLVSQIVSALVRITGTIYEWMKPVLTVGIGLAVDATRSRKELPSENALLRHQLAVLQRQVKDQIDEPRPSRHGDSRAIHENLAECTSYHPAGHAASLASGRLSEILTGAFSGFERRAPSWREDYRPDSNDGRKQPSL